MISSCHEGIRAPFDLPSYLDVAQYENSLSAKCSGDVSSSLHPNACPVPEVGTWMIVDDPGKPWHHQIEVVLDLPIAMLEASEDTDATKFQSVEQYSQWLRDGKIAPPIRVLQTEKGRLKALDHRRVLAAMLCGRESIRARVSFLVKADDHLLPMTFELGQLGFPVLEVKPARTEFNFENSDVFALRVLRTRACGSSEAAVQDFAV